MCREMSETYNFEDELIKQGDKSTCFIMASVIGTDLYSILT